MSLMLQVNLLAVVVAAVSSFFLGGLWYSPSVFGTTRKREAGDTRKPGGGHSTKVFAVSLLFAFLAAFIYALLMPAATGVPHAAMQGLAVGAGLVAMSFGINYQFANLSGKLLLIDGGYHTVQFVIYGLILGLWR